MGAPRQPGSRKVWSEEDEALLLELWHGNEHTIDQIGARLARSASAVRGRLTALQAAGRARSKRSGARPRKAVDVQATARQWVESMTGRRCRAVAVTVQSGASMRGQPLDHVGVRAFFCVQLTHRDGTVTALDADLLVALQDALKRFQEKGDSPWKPGI
jgi:hypothetical protein